MDKQLMHIAIYDEANYIEGNKVRTLCGIEKIPAKESKGNYCGKCVTEHMRITKNERTRLHFLEDFVGNIHEHFNNTRDTYMEIINVMQQ